MPPEGDVTLCTGFKIAHGDLEEIVKRFKDLKLEYNCTARGEVVRQVRDKDRPILYSTGEKLRKAGIVDDNGFMSRETRKVAEAALPTDGVNESEACPYLNFRDEHIRALA